MHRAHLYSLLRLATLAAVAACGAPDTSEVTAPTRAKPPGLTPVATISDARSGGEPHFYWLPPVAPATTYPGTFDAAAAPELRICPVANGACTAPFTVYTRTSSPAIAVSSAAQSFSLDWSTRPAAIGPGAYRAEVRLSGRLLGFADVLVVSNAKELKTVPPDVVGVQDGKSLTFAFRIETGVVGSVTISPRNDSITIGDTLRFLATVRDVHGDVIAGAAVAWTSRNPAVATISASGLAFGSSTGVTTIVATSGGVLDSTFLYGRQVPVARVVVSPSGTIPLTVGGHVAFTATMYDAAGNVLAGRPIAWTSNDTSVVSIGPDGLATARGPGISFIVASSESKRDSAFVDVTGGTVTCLRPWTLPDIWFAPNVYGRQVTGNYGTVFGTVTPTPSSGAYYPLALGESGATAYIANIITCSAATITLGGPVDLALGNLVSPTITGLDGLFALDPGATWDPSANGGTGGIVGSNATPGTESARVVQVGLYVMSDQSPGSATVRFRRTAWVFVESYVTTTGVPAGATRGDITFRFLRFGS